MYNDSVKLSLAICFWSGTVLIFSIAIGCGAGDAAQPVASESGDPVVNAAELSGDVDQHGFRELNVRSSVDGTMQPSRLWQPPDAGQQPIPMLVFLHSWSASYKQDKLDWLNEAKRRNWVFLQPNFRGPNQNPESCGSIAAQQDVLDAVDWVTAELNIDPSRIYLAGASGGGHMALLMAGRHPQRFSAVSAFVGITDLAEWHRFHSKDAKDGVRHRYAQNIEAACGGPPGESEAVDAEYRDRSPLTWLSNAGDLPVDLAAGIHDGKTGSVPFHHTLRAFNLLAAGNGDPQITDAEMAELWESGELSQPQLDDQAEDPAFGREIHLRRYTGRNRVSIFEGGHEGLPKAACAWLESNSRLSGFAQRP